MPAHGILEALTDDQRSQLLTWMEVFPAKVVLEMAAAPAPEGFGLKTHITSLRRFYEGAQRMETRHQLTVVAPAVSPDETAALQRVASSALTNFAIRT